MQMGLCRSNYLIKTYSEKQTRSWGFLTPTSQSYSHFCVEKQSTLQTVPPQLCVGGCHGASVVRASLRQHHLPAAQHHWRLLWKAERGDHEKLNVVEKPTAILTTLNRSYFHGLLYSLLKMVNSETKSDNSLWFLQVCTNYKASHVLLINFPPFLFQGSGGSEFPMDNCTLQSIAQSAVNRFSTTYNNNNISDVAQPVPEQ